jgi:HPt (histidine-containing phosphotransfer) domain-containing protein
VSDDVIDLEALKRLLEVIGGDPEDLDELLQEFEDVGPSTLATMQSAAANGDIDALRISSHSLKSNGRDFGATALAEACETLEHACKAGDVVDPVSQVRTIAVELDRARAALKSVSLP